MSTRIDWDKTKRRDRAKRPYDPIATFTPSYTRKFRRQHRRYFKSIART